jgi:predicted nucleotidyltransferase
MDIENLLRLLNERNVRYVIIGAAAFPLYGYTRSTIDTDIFIAADEDNAQRVHKALSDFGYDLTDISPQDLLKTKLLIRQYQVELDVHPFAKGVEFEGVWDRRVKGTYGNQPANFASLEDLILMKEAAGRVKDLEDLKVLRKLSKK